MSNFIKERHVLSLPIPNPTLTDQDISVQYLARQRIHTRWTNCEPRTDNPANRIIPRILWVPVLVILLNPRFNRIGKAYFFKRLVPLQDALSDVRAVAVRHGFLNVEDNRIHGW